MRRVYPVCNDGSFGLQSNFETHAINAATAAREYVEAHGVPESGKVCVRRPHFDGDLFWILNVAREEPQPPKVVVTDQRGIKH